MLAMLLAQAKLRGTEDLSDEYEFLLDSGEGVVTTGIESGFPILSPEQQARHTSFSKNPMFASVLDHVKSNQDEWVPFLQGSDPQNHVPSPWEPTSGTFVYLCFTWDIPNPIYL